MTAQPSAMATHRLSSLDGLRALACLMVFAVVFNPPFWTLAVEAQFYLLLPLLFLLLKGFQSRTVAGSLIILSGVAYFANLALWRFATGSAAATITTSVYTNYKPALIYSLLAY